MAQAVEAYPVEFYLRGNDAGEASANVIVPHVMRLVNPDSVVDVGCGEGPWLATFARHGVGRKLGIDGDYVRRDRLRFPVSEFQARDLSQQPFALPDRFALAVSLEVAEHLPAAAAAGLVESLVRLAPCVLFSAAVPFQGGTHHVNLQWQDYWARLFAVHDYVAVDAIRPLVWNDPTVQFFYRQNTLLYVSATHLSGLPDLQRIREATKDLPISYAHPEFVTYLGTGLSDQQLDSLYLGKVLPRLPGIVAQAIRRRFGSAR